MAIQVIDRAVRILRIVARRGRSTLSEVSRDADLPLPTTARILNSLAENGLVQRIDGRNYDLGARLLPLTTGLDSLRKALATIHPALEHISEATGADAGFAVLQGNEAVVVDWCYGHRHKAIVEPYAREIPLYCAFGKVLIAFQPSAWRERFLSCAKLKRMAEGTVLDKEVLAAELISIRRKGVHISHAENVEGAGSISVPVFDSFSRFQGALFLTAPLERRNPGLFAEFQPLLIETAKNIRVDLRAGKASSSSRSR